MHNTETVEKLGAEIIKCVNKFGAKHPGLKAGDVVMALMHAMSFAVATITTRAGRESAAMDVNRLLPDLLDRTLARAAEMEAGKAEPGAQVH